MIDTGRCSTMNGSMVIMMIDNYGYMAAFDILLDENTSFLQTIKEIDAAYTDADRDGWDSEAARRFEKLTQTLPDKTWLE